MTVLILGCIEAGKTTFNNALSKVLNARFNICEPAPKMENLTILDNRTEIHSDKNNITFLDLPRHQDYIDFFESKKEKVDAAVLILGVDVIKESELTEQVAYCKAAGIELACIYVPRKDFFDEEFMEMSLDFVLPVIEPIFNKHMSQSADNQWNFPVICGDSVAAIADPHGAEGDSLVQVYEMVKVMKGR